MTKKTREIMRVAVTPEAKAAFDSIADERGMKLMPMLSKVIEWFVAQDKTLQGVILGSIDDKDAPSVLGLIHKRLAQELTDKFLDIDSTIAEAKELDRKRRKKR
ncbi:MAG: hypothetical protein JXD19_05080 [Deltaproteobacteria bacterium]|nr:hypothetical protein [Deltaproteobacteria bacterium]